MYLFSGVYGTCFDVYNRTLSINGLTTRRSELELLGIVYDDDDFVVVVELKIMMINGLPIKRSEILLGIVYDKHSTIIN